jgi:hypothetical protein
LLRQIAKVKAPLTALGDLRPGSLSTQWNVCGTPGCRCKATPPDKHGPSYQVSFTRKGKSSSKFVRKQALAAVRRELKNYEVMKTPMDRWIDLATELSNLRLANNRSRSQPRTWHCPVRDNRTRILTVGVIWQLRGCHRL